MIPPSPADVERFRALIQERLGISCADWQEERLPGLLQERARQSHFAYAHQYLQFLSSVELAGAELGALAEHLTVGETYFFREAKQLEVIVSVALPELARRRRRSSGPLRILSAGCSSGEEAFSVALMLHEYNELKLPIEAEIIGIDLNPAAIKKAREGVYSMWSLRSTPEPMKERWFTPLGPCFRLRDEIRRMVTFEQRNLLTDDSSFFFPGAFDVVLCRNVTIYFSPQATSRVLERIERSLGIGGYLFLGHSESLRGLTHGLELLHTHDTFYYQRNDSTAPPIEAPAPRRSGESDRPPRQTEDAVRPFDANAWMNAIQRSTEKIAAVTRQLQIDGAAAKGAAAARERHREALALFQAERFSDALSALLSARAGAPGDPEVEILIAVIYFNQGLFADAASICAGTAWEGAHEAAAHYVLGLCREHEGQRSRAMEHYRTAIRIDRTFSMPHLRLGRLARRAGDIDAARSLTKLAAELIVRERPERIALFGGGFHQNALLELCRAELRACGEAS